jgi:DNA-binding response OmpR family regulator
MLSAIQDVTAAPLPEWVLLLRARTGDADDEVHDPDARGFTLSPSAANQEVDPATLARRPPRAVVIEAADPADSLRGLWRFLRGAGLAGTVPTLLAAPLGVVRALEHVPVDDFVIAPYGPDELAERIRRVEHRRDDRDQRRTVQAGALQIHTASRTVTVEGHAVALTPVEYALLAFLARHPARVFDRAELLARVWGCEEPSSSRTVDIHVRRLRAKLGAAAAPIETVRGVGYRFAAT